ncbi:uncharacterized protein [Haliotis cracherodii]|uniref:uncharacterized protein n=1 Tax=Haliotis cracherodii TaxID=6455 RepID=UPI0039ED379F
MEKVSVTLNQPVAVGFTILEHAKRLLYDFHYNVMLKEYDSDNVRVLMTDTDSLFYQIWSPVGTPVRDPQNFMLANTHLFDTSNYPVDHPLHSMERHKAIGLMKDEVGGKTIREFVGLRPKNYSFIFDKTPGERVEKRTAKGVQKAFVKKHLRHQMFKDCLFKHQQNISTFHQIRSIHNTLYTDKVTKLALTPQDDKRYLMIGNRFRVTGSQGEVLKEGRILQRSHLAACLTGSRCLERMLRHQVNGAAETMLHRGPFSVTSQEVVISKRWRHKRNHNLKKHIRSVFESVMTSVYVDELQSKVNELCNKDCYGCEVDHPSQVHHPCLMMGAEERVDIYFDDALSTMSHRLILEKTREQMASSSRLLFSLLNTKCYENEHYLNTYFFTSSRKEQLEQKLREKMRDF